HLMNYLELGLFISVIIICLQKVVFGKAAVATDSKKCSEIGRDVLMEKGSAVDAAIAALICTGIVHSHSSGIGGGVIFTIYNASTGNVEVINAKEVAPTDVDAKKLDVKLLTSGPRSIAVPGEISGYALAHKRHGRLSWKRLFEPSIQLAKEGHPVGELLGGLLNKYKKYVMKDATFCGQILKASDIIKFPKLAETLRIIAEQGPEAFYTGSIAQQIVDDVSKAGGNITLKDLANYKAKLDQPIKESFGKYTMYSSNIPSSGPVLGFILRILKAYNFSRESISTPEKRSLTYHRIIEAFKFAFMEWSKIGDPNFTNMDDVVEQLNSDLFAGAIKDRITDDTTHDEDYYGLPVTVPNTHGTTHLSVVAEDGSAVSVSSSINKYFGSNIRSRVSGIIFNNQMADFSVNLPVTLLFSSLLFSSLLFSLQQGKRPLSSMCPSIIIDENKEVKMVIGASGGRKIITATALVIMNAFWFGDNLMEAVEKPRVHHHLVSNKAELEAKIDQVIRDGLLQRNHELTNYTYSSTVQVIMKKDGKWVAKSDSRKGGYPAGY
uniref:Gamma-glutamyltranspeptidase 1-like n=1 Tax=Callorhinchus milii TaxID=7868 RepID=A0A4W3JU31_CALMI